MTAIAQNADPRPDAELLMVALYLHNTPDQVAGITGGGMSGLVGHNGVVREEGPFQGPTGSFVRIWYDDGTFREVPLPDAARAIAVTTGQDALAATNASDAPAPIDSITPASGEPSQPTEKPAECDPSYPDVCIAPVWLVSDLDCQDIRHRRFRVIGDDPHRFDGPYDGSNPSEPDGIGCERD